MKDVLDKIVAAKLIEVAATDYTNIAEEAKKVSRKTNSMSGPIRSKKGGVIAEFKRKSPSKGWINSDANLQEVVEGYVNGGAAAISILTDTQFFGGELSFLKRAREIAPLMPLLRKEFIIDANQIYEARVAGADAILLIASCLTVEKTLEFAMLAHSLSLEVLLEVHNESELGHINQYVDMVGVNNRNLGTFVTSTENSVRLLSQIKERAHGKVLISESGISDSKTMSDLLAVGYNGFLIGESLMRGGDAKGNLQKLISEL